MDVKAVNKKELIVKRLMSIGELMVVPNMILFIFLFTTTIFLKFENPDGILATLVNVSLPFSLGYIVYPWLRYIKTKDDVDRYGLIYRKNRIGRSVIILSALMITCSFVILTKRNELLEYLPLGINFIFIAIGEETLTRGILIDKLKKIMKIDYAIWIGALIFSFIFHNNGEFITNLIIRFPLGLVLGYMYKYSKSLYPPMAFHLAYNIMVSSI